MLQHLIHISAAIDDAEDPDDFFLFQHLIEQDILSHYLPAHMDARQIFIKYQLPALWKNTQTLYALIQLIHQHPGGFFISQLISDISDILSDILFRTLSQGEMVLTVHIPS